MSELSGLYDCARLTRELGVSRKVADKIIRRCPKQTVPDVRKSYVRGEDVQRLLDENLHNDVVTAPLGRVA